LTVSVAVCVITVVHAGVVELIARTLYTYVPALKLPTVNVTVLPGDAPVVCVATTLLPCSNSYVVYASTGCADEPTVIVALVTFEPTPPAAQIAFGEIETGRSSGSAFTATFCVAVPWQPLLLVTTTVTVAVPLAIPN